MEQSKELADFTDRAVSTEEGVLNLESYLIMPVQRILRYKLLLEESPRCRKPQTLSRRLQTPDPKPENPELKT